ARYASAPKPAAKTGTPRPPLATSPRSRGPPRGCERSPRRRTSPEQELRPARGATVFPDGLLPRRRTSPEQELRPDARPVLSRRVGVPRRRTSPEQELRRVPLASSCSSRRPVPDVELHQNKN